MADRDGFEARYRALVEGGSDGSRTNRVVVGETSREKEDSGSEEDEREGQDDIEMKA